MIIIDSGTDATAVVADPGFPSSAPDSRYPVRHNFPPGGSGERAASHGLYHIRQDRAYFASE
ncbi:MAG TPA: hypothetical protein VK208_08345 [Pyrinomonadaceae bacterium]|jgi:hypothetical protein|nr:hypothetical protein [Pyrinomonadaceae bacterium]